MRHCSSTETRCPLVPPGWLTSLALAAVLAVAGCSSTPATGQPDGGGAGDAGQVVHSDGGATDGGITDGGTTDGGTTDGGITDGGITDGGITDGGVADGGVACNPGGPLVDTQTDPDNCGQCGKVCPGVAHAARACHAGTCGRGPCDPGWFDLDGPAGPGCVWQCASGTCTSSSGQTVPVSTNPLPESGLVFQGLVSSSSWGGAVETSTHYTNIGALGEPTPPGVGGATRQTSASYVNIGGLDAVEPQ